MAKHSSTRIAISFLVIFVCRLSAKATFSKTVMESKSAAI